MANDTNGDSATFDIVEFQKRLQKARDALWEAEQFVYDWAEIEKRKRNATPTETQ